MIMICLGQWKVKFMRKYSWAFIFLCSTLLWGVSGEGMAQTQTMTQATNTTTSGEEKGAVSAESGHTDSFADIAVLGEQIAIAQRKIQAMTLKNSLEALQAQQSMGTFPFKVLRVEGFGNTLYAVLTDDAGIVYQVGPGDLVGKQYRVSLIRPYSVGVVDINTQKAYAVPFVIGGAGEFVNDFSSAASPAMSAENKPVTSSQAT